MCGHLLHELFARSASFHADVEFAWTATLFGGASAASEAFPPCDHHRGWLILGMSIHLRMRNVPFLYDFCQNFYMPIKLRSLSSAFSRFQKISTFPRGMAGNFKTAVVDIWAYGSSAWSMYALLGQLLRNTRALQTPRVNKIPSLWLCFSHLAGNFAMTGIV